MGVVPLFRSVIAALLVLCMAAPVSAARQIVDLHRLDAYFALFASDSNVPWRSTDVRLDTYSSAPVAFSVYEVHPGDVVTAGSNARPRAIDTRGRNPIARFSFAPPGGYQFQSNRVGIPLGNREGFFVVEARRGDVGEQVWINRTRIGLITKETPGELLVYGADLGSGKALAHMRVQFLVGGNFQTRETDARGMIRWSRSPRPIFALAQWGESYAFTSLLPQAPLPPTIVGVRTETAVVHAGDTVRVVGFARTRSSATLKPARGTANVSMRLGGRLTAQQSVSLDDAGAFSVSLPVPADAPSGDYAVLAQVDGGVGSASVHVDASANGLTLGIAAACELPCDGRSTVPITITSSQPGAAVRVTVIRTPHIYVGYTPDDTPWATTKWFEASVRTGSDGRATVMIPAPTDGLASTFGVRAEAGGATAVTRVLAPTARAVVRIQLQRAQQTLGTPVDFDVYGNDLASANPVAGATVTARLIHGPSVQEQRLTLDRNGHAHGTFSAPELGMNFILASLDTPSGSAQDAGQIYVVPQATNDATVSGSANASIALDRHVYHPGDDVRVRATLPGAVGDVLVTAESAIGTATTLANANGGSVTATVKASDAPGDLRIGAAFVRDGAIEWTSVPLALDAPGRPQFVSLAIDGAQFSPGAAATVRLDDSSAAQGTVIVRISRGAPSGSALFDSAPSLMAVGLAATQVTAPGGLTWHPWVDSTGEHAQVLGFVRRSLPPQDLSISDADTQAVSWSVARGDGRAIDVQLPQARGRYTLSILKITDDGRVVAGSSSILVQ